MLSTDTYGSWTVVHPTGEIDLATADEFRQTVLDALERADTVAIDFSEVTFMDSSGVKVIVAGVNHTRDHGGSLVVVGLPKRVRLVLDLTGMSKVLDIRPSVADLDVEQAAS